MTKKTDPKAKPTKKATPKKTSTSSKGQTKSANSGVHTGTGIEFQKHCALYVFLEEYESIKDKTYFICIEHYDDFLFCFEKESDVIQKIATYQAKKASSKWSLDSTFCEILEKIISVGAQLRTDEIKKTPDYSHELHFITNHLIELKYDSKDEPVILKRINEEEVKVKYATLHGKLKNKFNEGFKALNTDSSLLSELNHVSLYYADFGKTDSAQRQLLIGKFAELFGDKVHDHQAAVKLLIGLFRDIELVFNQGKTPKLLDKSKRLHSDRINEALNVITSKQKALAFWKSKKEEISVTLGIPSINMSLFKLQYENSFDLFKDLKQAEHLKILRFVKDNRNILEKCYTEKDCIHVLHNQFNKNHSTTLNELQLKAAICAAYIQIYHEN